MEEVVEMVVDGGGWSGMILVGRPDPATAELPDIAVSQIARPTALRRPHHSGRTEVANVKLEIIFSG